jgi:hypothetical protein
VLNKLKKRRLSGTAGQVSNSSYSGGRDLGLCLNLGKKFSRPNLNQCLGAVGCIYNPSYTGSTGQTWHKAGPCLKNNQSKRCGSSSAQAQVPEFKPQDCPNEKKTIEIDTDFFFLFDLLDKGIV